MPARSKITQLPPEIKEAVDRLLIERGFSGYAGMADEINAMLAAAGLEITLSHSGLHRYGQDFEERIAAIKIATEQATAITDAVGDDAGKMGNSLLALVQQKAFNVLVKMKDLEPEDIDFSKLTVAIAKLNNAAVAQKKWMAETRAKATAAADEVVKVAKKGGLSEQTAEQIRKKILGIV